MKTYYYISIQILRSLYKYEVPSTLVINRGRLWQCFTIFTLTLFQITFKGVVITLGRLYLKIEIYKILVLRLTRLKVF